MQSSPKIMLVLLVLLVAQDVTIQPKDRLKGILSNLDTGFDSRRSLFGYTYQYKELIQARSSFGFSLFLVPEVTIHLRGHS